MHCIQDELTQQHVADCTPRQTQFGMNRDSKKRDNVLNAAEGKKDSAMMAEWPMAEQWQLHAQRPAAYFIDGLLAAHQAFLQLLVIFVIAQA